MPQTPTAPPHEQLSRRVTAALGKLGLALRSEARAGASSRGMSPTQGEILLFLLRSPGSSLSEVAEALSVTRPTVSDAVDTLVRKGFVTKNKAERDPRILSLVLTEAGTAEAQLATGWPDKLHGAVDTLSKEEQAVWFRGLVKMIDRLREGGSIQAVRMCTACKHFRRNASANASAPHRCALLEIDFSDLDLRIECPEFGAR